jgi:hypothetical protein
VCSARNAYLRAAGARRWLKFFLIGRAPAGSPPVHVSNAAVPQFWRIYRVGEGHPQRFFEGAGEIGRVNAKRISHAVQA